MWNFMKKSWKIKKWKKKFKILYEVRELFLLLAGVVTVCFDVRHVFSAIIATFIYRHAIVSVLFSFSR